MFVQTSKRLPLIRFFRFGHELFEPRRQERPSSPRRSYRKSPRRAPSVDTAYAQLRPPNPGSTAHEATRGLDTSHVPRRNMQERQPNIMNRPELNMSATAEAGSKRSTSPLPTPPVGRSERRRITRREARRKRDGIGNSGLLTSDTEASTAAGQRQTSENRGMERLGQSAPALGQGGDHTFPFPLQSKSAPASKQAVTDPPVFAAQKSAIEQGHGPLITPSDLARH